MSQPIRRRFAPLAIGLAAVLAAAAPAHAQTPVRPGVHKVLPLPIRTDGPKSLDPAHGSTVYDNMACVQAYETLLQNKYQNPLEYEPLLLAEMPTSSDGGVTWRFKIKEGVHFHDNKCFPGGKGRHMVPEDVFYSFKRLMDKRNLLKNEWLLKDTIKGLDAYAAAQNAAIDADTSGRTRFNYDLPVEGFRAINNREFEIELTEPVSRFLWVLTMFQTSIVPREAVEFYGENFAFNPVGTGPYVLDEWIPKKSITFNRNPNYHECYYPDDWSREDRRLRLHRAAGTRLPIVDRLEFTMFVQDQPMWLKFMKQPVGELAYTEVPAEYYEQAFNKRTGELLPEIAGRGITAQANPLLDFIFRGFNMEDPLVGGYDEKRTALRRAISLAADLRESNEVFYNGLNILYDGPIPPQLEGYPEGGRVPSSPMGPDLDQAREMLRKAGYTVVDGKVVDLPAIKYYTSQGGNNAEQTELFQRQLAKVGIRIEPQLVDFSELIRITNDKKAPMFAFAWSSDYPDAENNLALFYSPNVSPGSNHFNYSRPEFDTLYQRVRTMLPSSERTALYERMRDMVIHDVPYIGSMARTRHYLIAPWVRNAKITERYWGWFKYLDVEPAAR